MKVYVANPLGFSPELHDYKQKVLDVLRRTGHEPVDPWAEDYSKDFASLFDIKDVLGRKSAGLKLAEKIGRRNQELIDGCDAVLAILDGPEPDSGTVSELGYAVGRGLRGYGLRTDLRDCGDFFGPALNLQVEWWIAASGGELFRSINSIVLPLAAKSAA